MANVLVVSMLVLLSSNNLLAVILNPNLDLELDEALTDMLLIDMLLERRKDTSLISNKYNKKYVVSYTPKEKAAILAKHNEFRSQVSPKAMDMEYMEWNEDLATIAGLWASICFWGHGTPDIPLLQEKFGGSVGQNLWKGGSKPNGVNAVNAWHNNEVAHYNYATKKCATGKVCGHYTQIVWGKSRQVGCARALCPVMIDRFGNPTGEKNKWLYACQYYPRGNYAKARPYLEGPSCGACPEHARLCYDNMCTNCTSLLEYEPSATCDCRKICYNCGVANSECRCDCVGGWYRHDCSKVCSDWHDKCNTSPGWPNSNYCDRHASIPNKCPVMCSVCSPENECIE